MRVDEDDDHRIRSFRSIMKSVQPMLAQAVQRTREASSAPSSLLPDGLTTLRQVDLALNRT